MQVKKLNVQGVRNIRQAVLHPAPTINIIYGENGSGKTSLLEAIFLLGRGRSFRTRKLNSIISKSSESCTVFALLSKESEPALSEVPVGVSRSANGGFQFKVAGRQVNSASQLAANLPILLINSDSFTLITGGPGDRRRFIDWGVFHVEHEYRDIWRKFQRCHKQRNHLLRHDRMTPSQLFVWDREFVRLSEQVAIYRQRYFDKILPEFHKTLALLNNTLNIDLSLYRGWDVEQTLSEELKRNHQRDQNRKITHHGAHRADLRFICEGQPAAEVLSRGQEKLVVLALQIAQGRLLALANNTQCLYLLDDLAAELDQRHFAKGLGLLVELEAQLFMTGTSKELMQAALPEIRQGQISMFHVEHGEIEQEGLVLE
jgi:DNA replication and repair protein RecF